MPDHATPANAVPFARMNGLGNRILVIDMRGRNDRVTPDAAIALAADPATDFDQIMAVHDPASEGTTADIRILNRDGSAAGACGNGMRCVASALHDEHGGGPMTFTVGPQVLNAAFPSPDAIAIDMGRPRLRWDEIPLEEEFGDTTGIELQIGPIDAPVLHTPSVANMGNPHAVFWVGDVWAHDLERHGSLLEHHPIFPEKANISLAHVTAPDALTLRTWERGVGITEACGSAACAAAVSAARKGLTGRRVTVTLPGGDLDIEWREDDHVVMTGPAEWEWSGTLDPATGAWMRTRDEAAE